MNGMALEDGDIHLVAYGDKLRFARCGTRAEAVMRNIVTNLRTELGEHFHDGELGVPWVGGILGQGVLGAAAARSEVTDVIRAVEGVESVDKVEVSFSGRNMAAAWSVTLDDGTTVSGEA